MKTSDVNEAMPPSCEGKSMPVLNDAVADPSADNGKDVLECENETTDVTGRFFDRIGDFFQKMTLGIVRFAFVELPVRLFRMLFNWKRWLDILRFLKRFGRAVFWVVTWLFLIQAYFIIRDVAKFLNFWRDVWNYVVTCFLHGIVKVLWDFLVANAGVIWTVIALLGSIYGILYVTLKKRAKKRGVEFRGVFRHKVKRRSEVTETAEESTKEV